MKTLTPADVGMVRWFRSLPQRTREAILLFFATGDTSLLRYEFNHLRPGKAA